MDVMDLLAQARPDSLDTRPDPARRASDLARAVATPRAGAAARPDASPHRRGRLRARPARLVAIGTSMAALATTAGVVAALNVTGTPAARPQRTAGTAVTRPGELRNAILTAFKGVSGDVFYTRITEIYSGTMSRWDGVSENWSYPLQPQAGQDVRVRSLALPRNSKNKSDTEWFYSEPASTQPGVLPPMTKTEMIDVEYGNRTWSDTTINASFASDVPSLQNLRESIAEGKFSDIRKTELNGRTVLELTLHVYAYGTQPGTWWVDPVTYLPVRMLDEQAGITYQYDFGFLPPTPANIAQLKVVVPAGFTRTPTQKLP